MPLDTGAFVETDLHRGQPARRRSRPVLDPELDVGAGLRAVRESQGLTLEGIAEVTRVRAAHLAAIEALKLDQLPSRPFTVGYVRAYAKALGLDADAAASRFRSENPSPDDDLHSPVGVAHQRAAGRNRTVGFTVALLAVAVVTWNITRHAVAESPARSAAVHAHAAPTPGPARGPAGAVGAYQVGSPLPPPPEATTPDPYKTPGLDPSNAVTGSAGAAEAPSNSAAAKPADPAAPPTPFVAQGAIYGPTVGVSGLIIQAKKPISLEVRGAGGVVYFARQLAAGEAYRVPALEGLTAEVSNPASAELFEGGLSRGLFTQAQTPLKVAG
jgi:cytoskeletal protein RodZ